jgi:hypothetical protein
MQCTFPGYRKERGGLIPGGTKSVRVYCFVCCHHLKRFIVPQLSWGELINYDDTQPSATTTLEPPSPKNMRIATNDTIPRKISLDKLLYSSKDLATLTITTSVSLMSDSEYWYEWPSSPARQCSSPDLMWPCTGYCVPTSPKEANVVGRYLGSADVSSSSDLNRFHWRPVKTINYHGRMAMERQ